MRPTRCRQGATLLELMVWIALVMGLTSILYMILQLGLHYHRQTRVRSELLKEISLALGDLGHDLANTRSDSVDVGPDYVWMLSAEPPAPQPSLFQYGTSGELLWQKRYCYFREAAGRQLCRTEIALDTPTEQVQPPPEPLPTLADFTAVTGPSRHIVARQIEVFEVATDGSDSLIEVRVVAQADLDSTHQTRLELRSRLLGGNS